MKTSIFIKTAIAVIATLSLGSANVSAVVVNEEENLLKTITTAESNATQKGIIKHVEVSQPTEAKINDKGVTGDSGFGEISVSFDEHVRLEDIAQTEYAVDTEVGAVAKATSEVGMLLQTEKVEKHEQFIESKWDLSLPEGVEAISFDDGSIGFRMETENGVSAISETTISAPWAVDEHGNSLETWYEISTDGSSITQIVNTQDIEGKIILDPRVTYGRGIYINWYGGELRALKAAGSTSLALAAGYGCAQVSQLRHPALIAIAGLLCLTVGSPVAIRSLRYALNNLRSINDGTCYQWKVGSYYMNTVPASGNCRP
ncbi:Uncharacterised protein [Corynebacterium kutscheri]|uniref:Uncharacterized protein n=1 Tax=Corynebacterium kutscheri TaxID=35755 RepID=A0A0F6TEM5_9CORY|nr:hypothetical protein [Corynebacterium kutscheri]AKE42201.1 hypothetical protein UL82_10335 [Corynebacterium kutscheri]VEH10544.1 Uncharacterised protein [Corynebacterium kutscheri]VEH81667.1 Uncharacterised protein [Corynebacterium kutscheri]